MVDNIAVAGTPASASTQATPGSSAPAGSGSIAPAQVAPAGGQPPSGTPATTTGWDYKSDPRFGKVWKSEADIIQGYHSLEDIHEKKYKPTYEKYSSFEKKFSEGKLDINKLDEYLKNYNEWASPENPRNQLWEYLNETIDDPVTAQDFQNYMKKLNEEKNARRYPGMTQEQRMAAIQRDNELKDLKTKFSSIEHEKAVNSNLQTISKNEESIKKLCADKGFEFTDNIKKEFWTFCRGEIGKKSMTLDQMPYVFLMKYGSELDKAYENKIKSSMIEQQRTQKATTVTFAKKPDLTKDGKLPFKERLGAAYKRFQESGKPAQT